MYQSGTWTQDNFECVEGATLVMNGGSWYVEVHAPGELRRKLSSYTPNFNFGPTLDYFNGHLLLCGGNVDGNECFRGDYNASTKGRFFKEIDSSKRY